MFPCVFALLFVCFSKKCFKNTTNEQKNVNISNRQTLHHVPIEKEHLLASSSMETVLDLCVEFDLLNWSSLHVGLLHAIDGKFWGATTVSTTDSCEVLYDLAHRRLSYSNPHISSDMAIRMHFNHDVVPRDNTPLSDMIQLHIIKVDQAESGLDVEASFTLQAAYLLAGHACCHNLLQHM